MEYIGIDIHQRESQVVRGYPASIETTTGTQQTGYVYEQVVMTIVRRA